MTGKAQLRVDEVRPYLHIAGSFGKKDKLQTFSIKLYLSIATVDKLLDVTSFGQPLIAQGPAGQIGLPTDSITLIESNAGLKIYRTSPQPWSVLGFDFA